MHPHIKRLMQCAGAQRRLIIGLMSGTSLDGLDIALCELVGSGQATQVNVRQFKTMAYPESVKDKIRHIFARTEVDLEYLTLLNGWLGRYHGELINQVLREWNVSAQDIDVIASHGQTVYHCPAHQHNYTDFGHGTLQIADADHIAVSTGITTISDFRQKHIAAGGEGAPLAHYGDYYYFSSSDEHRILLNMGGIANITWLPKKASFDEVLCSDIGPSNTIMDAYMRRYCGLEFDHGGEFAKQGAVSSALLEALLSEPFIKREMPKTTGPEVFNLQMLTRAQTLSDTLGLSHKDVMATLTVFSADVIAKHINMLVDDKPVAIYASGGGYHNTLLVSHILSKLTPLCRFMSCRELGIDPDAKEAVLFAILANEALVGDKCHTTLAANNMPLVTMGKISFPD